MFFVKSVAKIAQIFEHTKRYVYICTYLYVFLYFNLWGPGYLHIFIYIRYVTCWSSNMGYVDTQQYANIQKHVYWKIDTHIVIYANIWIAFIRKNADIYVFGYLRILVFECLYVWVLSYTQI